MNKGVACILALLFFVSCIENDNKDSVLLTMSLNEAIKDDVSFLESIKVVPLETLDTALVKTPQSFQPLKSEGKFLLFDTNQIVFLFDNEGILLVRPNIVEEKALKNIEQLPMYYITHIMIV